MHRDELNKNKTADELVEKLKQKHVFWSYKFNDDNEKRIADDVLIENVLLHLDIEDIIKLYHLFPKKNIMQVWKKKLLPNNEIYASLNRFYAFWLFDIKDPDGYINKALKALQQT